MEVLERRLLPIVEQPPLTLERLSWCSARRGWRTLWVVRDDLMPGGTKARVLPVLFSEAHSEYVYASPVQGYAQVALAHCARQHGKRATVFCAARQLPHPRTCEAERAGAVIRPVAAPAYMTVVRARAREYCATTGAFLLPFGLDVAPFVQALAGLARLLPLRPAEVWSVAGSGVLQRSLQLAWPEAAFHAVRIGAEPKAGRAKVYEAPEGFESSAELTPPFPSCSNYDAKAWRFLEQFAADDALFWNVAK